MRVGSLKLIGCLTKAAQVIRVSEGLYTRSQIPLVRMKVENYGDWGDGTAPENSLSIFLATGRNRSGRHALIADLMALNELHLRALARQLRVSDLPLSARSPRQLVGSWCC